MKHTLILTMCLMCTWSIRAQTPTQLLAQKLVSVCSTLSDPIFARVRVMSFPSQDSGDIAEAVYSKNSPFKAGIDDVPTLDILLETVFVPNKVVFWNKDLNGVYVQIYEPFVRSASLEAIARELRLSYMAYRKSMVVARK